MFIIDLNAQSCIDIYHLRLINSELISLLNL